MYKYKQSGNTYILSLDNHVEVTEALAAFCEEKNIQSGRIDGIGAICEATFRFLDPATKKYVDKTFAEQMEITALVGNVSRKDGKVYLHIHVTASRRDYTCIGGHLLTARINGACELFVTDLGVEVGRYLDTETGLNLYKL
jgi:predicted DNA-binding protein with PD1-like motif